MTALAVLHLKVSFEISLPHIVWLALLKPLMVRCCLTGFLCYEVVTVKDIVEGSCAGEALISFIFHDLTDLHSPQGGILLPHPHNERLGFLRHPSGLRQGRTASVAQGFLIPEPLKPFITCRTADAVFPAQSCFALFFGEYTPYKFLSHVFYSPFLPSHLLPFPYLEHILR